MTFNDALFSLGVRDDSLTSEETAALDRDGFVVLRDIFTSNQADIMRDTIEKIFVDDRAGQPDGPPECGNLQNRSDVFDICFTNARVLAAVAHVLNAGIPAPLLAFTRGQIRLAAGTRLFMSIGTAMRRSLASIACATRSGRWKADFYRASNGANFCVIPGSHLFGVNPHDTAIDREAPHPDEVSLEVQMGSVAIFNSHLWHGATLNRSDAYRPNVTSYWSRTKWPGRVIAPNELSPTAAARLNEAARRLFASTE